MLRVVHDTAVTNRFLEAVNFIAFLIGHTQPPLAAKYNGLIKIEVVVGATEPLVDCPNITFPEDAPLLITISVI